MSAVRIEYAALPVSEGYIPVRRYAGREWAWLRSQPVSFDRAQLEARLAAKELADGYSGDWDVTVVEYVFVQE